MTYKKLIAAGKTHLEKYPGQDPAPDPATLFSAGARWMSDRLNQLDGNHTPAFNPHINYTLYGSLKYGICLLGCGLSGWWLSKYSMLLTPLSILVFFLLEVNFLFLFPLLIDNSATPVRGSIRAVFKIGILKCVFTVIPIALFMVVGLFRKRETVRNWYIGCLAILIWYNDEVRNRI
ncbi:MAG TPA: hypothetical protein VNS58_32230 [Puia sp.]|nr:hypothetical protein [Puia sp.]